MCSFYSLYFDTVIRTSHLSSVVIFLNLNSQKFWNLVTEVKQCLCEAIDANRIDKVIKGGCFVLEREFSLQVSCKLLEPTLLARYLIEIEGDASFEKSNVLAEEAPLKHEVSLQSSSQKVLGLVTIHRASAQAKLSEEQAALLKFVCSEMARALEFWLRFHGKAQELEAMRSANLATSRQFKTLQLFYDLEKAYSDTLEIQDFLTIISNKLFAATSAGHVLIICRENDEQPVAFFAGQRSAVFTWLEKKSMFQKKSFAIRIKSGFEGADLAEMTSTEVSNHLGVPFHSLQEFHGETFDIWGRVELLNHPQKFNDQDLSFLNVVADKVTAAFMRHRLLERKTSKERLATIGQLSSSIIHDFRNPMTSIRGFAELIKINGDTMDVDQRSKICTIIMNQVDRCTNMIEELLSFARGDKNYTFEECKIDRFLADLVELIRVETEKNGIKLSYHFDCDLTATIDRDKMMRVLLNLTNNSIEILEEGEELILSSTVTADGQVEVRVTDTGPGVPKPLRSSLFEAFVTHGKQSGTGLGLHISKDIVEAHGGLLRLDENYEAGACFILSFPCHFGLATQAS